MTKSESIVKLATALTAFQKEVEGAKKSADNPYYSSKYADLAEIWRTIREPLTKHGLSVTQLCSNAEPVRIDDKNITFQIAVETVLLHSSGEFISGVVTLPITKRDPQAAGSAITYARRYGLSAILGIHQEDDDANTHREKSEPAPTKAPSKQFLTTLLNDKFASGTEQHEHYTELIEVASDDSELLNVQKQLMLKLDKPKATSFASNEESRAKQFIITLLDEMIATGKSVVYIRNSVKKHLNVNTEEKDWKAIVYSAPFEVESYRTAYSHWKEELVKLQKVDNPSEVIA